MATIRIILEIHTQSSEPPTDSAIIEAAKQVFLDPDVLNSFGEEIEQIVDKAKITHP